MRGSRDPGCDLTFTPETVQREVFVFEDDFGPRRRGSFREEIEEFGRADCLRPQAGRGWRVGKRGVPEDGHLGEHLLPVAEEVGRHGSC